MRHRDFRQPREFAVAEFGMFALQDTLRGRPAQTLVRAIHLRQQRSVGGRVFGGEPLPPIDLRLHFPGLSMRSNQPRNLRQAQAGDLAQVGADRTRCFLRCCRYSWSTSIFSTHRYTSARL
jgi:hypothetical protein